MLLPVILAGGVGSRLWPLSRAALPKQFITFPQQQTSLFQQTVTRLDGIDDVKDPLVVCNADHRFLVAEQLRQLGNNPSNILLEPMGRNTAPAVAMAALLAMQQQEDICLLVLPADHLIADMKSFHDAIAKGIELAQQNLLVTFGIVPSAPETGYGYIEQGEQLDQLEAYRVARFVEKPDKEKAESYIASGKFVWNSGMFLFRAQDYLEELKATAPDILQTCEQCFADLQSGPDFKQIPEKLFATCRSESIDYAVMEKTERAAVVPLDAGWNDLGAWDALYDVETKDAANNVLSGDVLTTDTSDCYIQAQSRLVAAVGLRNAVVIETSDAVMVADRAQVQSVKKIVEQLEATGRDESITHALVNKPWGSYQTLAQGDGYQLKHIVVNPGQALSLQLHHQRSEHWTVVKGSGLITCDDNEFSLGVNESTFIPLGSKHRLANASDTPVEIIEVQIGDYLGEDDIVRFEDQYGRVE